MSNEWESCILSVKSYWSGVDTDCSLPSVAALPLNPNGSGPGHQRHTMTLLSGFRYWFAVLLTTAVLLVLAAEVRFAYWWEEHCWRRKYERHTTTESSSDAGTPGAASPGSA